MSGVITTVPENVFTSLQFGDNYIDVSLPEIPGCEQLRKPVCCLKNCSVPKKNHPYYLIISGHKRQAILYLDTKVLHGPILCRGLRKTFHNSQMNNADAAGPFRDVPYTNSLCKFHLTNSQFTLRWSHCLQYKCTWTSKYRGIKTDERISVIFCLKPQV